MLQEVPTWAKLNDFTYSGHTVVSFENSDCGFIIPRPWMSAVRSLSSVAYWCGAVLGNHILLSAHVLDHLVEDGRAAMFFRETLHFVHEVLSSFTDVKFEITLGVDANTGLPPNFDDISGSLVLPLRHSHSPGRVRVVTAWLEALGV